MEEVHHQEPDFPEDEPGSESNPQLSLWSDPVATPPQLSPGEFESDIVPELDPPWSIRDLLAFVGFGIFTFVCANLLAILIFALLHDRFFPEITATQAFTKTPWIVSMQSGWELLWLVFIYLTVSKKYHRRFWEALKWRRGPHAAVIYLAGGVLLAVAAQSIVNLFPSEKELPIEKLFSSPQSGYLLAFFGICIAPFVEEMVFRGFFYPVFERMWGLAAAVLLTALLFAAIHVPQLSGGWQEITGIFFVGVALSYCRGKTRSLVPSFLMHIAYNTSLFVSLYFSTDHFHNLKG